MRHTLLHHNINTTKVIIVGDLVMAAGPYLLLFNLRMCVIPWNVVVVAAAAAAADVYYPAYDTLPAVVVGHSHDDHPSRLTIPWTRY
ncbi:predicted protein [Lichtheimia corymbifera JMRC:FSU:9682]|uniref:Uncharacterized protein n=1 Tax=Lichtheimia corymbifera JMRC:FSU:9682 TaxID=1263082 RepID=A0A068SB09_9FUNG|nr:predicted protein [Lichtheimia corymbifera JMRC:FSU:9682]